MATHTTTTPPLPAITGCSCHYGFDGIHRGHVTAHIVHHLDDLKLAVVETALFKPVFVEHAVFDRPVRRSAGLQLDPP